MHTNKTPAHVAIIMDGNGRWAERRGKSRTLGHVRGARVAKKIIAAAVENKISHLTLFAFSTENWFRPENEVHFLMHLLTRQIQREIAMLIKNNVRFRVIGDIARLPISVRTVVENAIAQTKNNTGLNLVFAISYGGRQEIVLAAKSLAKKILNSEIQLDEIDEALFANELESSFLPDPDLIIRTSGECRISNFFLWQAAYSEIYIHNKLWPDFTASDFSEALSIFARRERRMGRVVVAHNTENVLPL